MIKYSCLEDGRGAQTIRGMHDTLAKTVTALRFFAITYPDLGTNSSGDARTWWRVQDCEEGRVAKSIPRWKGERLRTRLLNMDSKALADLTASDIDLLYNQESEM